MEQNGIQEPGGVTGELLLESVGQRLRLARERAGLSLAEISARTKIAERQLEAIEEDRFAELASRTYAIGFSRTYARAVGLDEQAIAQAVRDQLDAHEATWQRPVRESFEPGDPARVPPMRLALLAGLGVIAVIVLLAVFWDSMVSPSADLPDLSKPKQEAPAKAVPAKKAAAPANAAPPGGAVVFTALEDSIWVKFYDEDGAQLFQKQMAKGESFTVPADASGPQLWTGRPDALAVTIGGTPVPKIETEPVSVKNVPVSAAALLARPKPEASASSAAASPARGERQTDLPAAFGN